MPKNKVVGCFLKPSKGPRGTRSQRYLTTKRRSCAPFACIIDAVFVAFFVRKKKVHNPNRWQGVETRLRRDPARERGRGASALDGEKRPPL